MWGSADTGFTLACSFYTYFIYRSILACFSPGKKWDWLDTLMEMPSELWSTQVAFEFQRRAACSAWFSIILLMHLFFFKNCSHWGMEGRGYFKCTFKYLCFPPKLKAAMGRCFSAGKGLREANLPPSPSVPFLFQLQPQPLQWVFKQ